MSGIRERESSAFSSLELLDGLDVPMVTAGLDGLLRVGNRAAANLYGLEVDDLAGRPLASGLLAGATLGASIVETVLEHGSWQGRVEVPSAFAGTAKYEARATPLAEAYGELGVVAIGFFGIADREQAPAENLRATIDSLSAHVAVVNVRGEVVAVNQAWRRFALANGAATDFRGSNYLEVCDAAGTEPAARVGRQLRELLAGERESIDLEYPFIDPSGERWFAIRGMPYASNGQRWAIVIHLDITDRHKSEQHLKMARDYLRAVTDSMGQGMCTVDEQGRLTYLNQAAQEMLGWSLDELRGRDMHTAIHATAGECPIQRTAQHGQVVRVEEDVFVRADGTEMPVAYTAAPFSLGDGVEGTVVVFEDISERQAQTRQMERDLEKLAAIKRIRHALSHDGFLLYAQPIVDLDTGEAVQRELLIRMRNQEGDGVLAPGAFLPAAEEYGFIGDIDRWVVERSAEVAARGRAVELNISAASLGDPGLIHFIADAIERTGADPTKMVFEITETTLVSDQAAGREFVTALHELGCKVALDDFGTGYGGFTYLKQLPIDYLKIDIEFVRDLAHSMASRKVVEAIVNLAHGFELQTVAEGVEDERTLALLRELEVDYAQGYYLGRPAELEI